MSYDNNMQIILEKVVSDKPNAPTLRINMEIDGKKYKAGLWPWVKKDGSAVTDKNGNAKYKGRLEIDDYQPQAKPQRTPMGDVAADDVPF